MSSSPAPSSSEASPPETSQAPPSVSQAAPVTSQAPPVSEPVDMAPPQHPMEEVSRDGSVVQWGPPVGSSVAGSAAPQHPSPQHLDFRRAFSWSGVAPLGGLGFGTTPTYNGPQPGFPPPQQQWYLGQGPSQGHQQLPPQLPQYPQFPAHTSSLPAAAGAPPPPPPLEAGGDISLMFQTLTVNQNAQEAYIRQLQVREQETLANQLVFKRKFKEEVRAADLLHDTEKV